jgi:hypothetical protein
MLASELKRPTTDTTTSLRSAWRSSAGQGTWSIFATPQRELRLDRAISMARREALL